MTNDTALADRLEADAQSLFHRCTANRADLALGARRLRELGAENFALAAGACEYRSGDDWGHPLCLACNMPPTDVAGSIADLQARIAELEAERAWRPIETAPKDGTYVDLWVHHATLPLREGFRIANACWVVTPTRGRAPGWYYEYGEELASPLDYGRICTHFRLLPPAPTERGTEEGKV